VCLYVCLCACELACMLVCALFLCMCVYTHKDKTSSRCLARHGRDVAQKSDGALGQVLDL